MSEVKPSYADLVGAIYGAATHPERWTYVLDDLSNYFDAAGANIMYQRNDGSPGVLASRSLHEPLSLYMAENWYPQDVFAHRMSAHMLMSEECVVTSRELLQPGEAENLPIYTDFYRRFGLGQLTSISLLGAFGVPAALGFHRSLEKGDPDENTREEMLRIGAHIENALKVSITMADSTAEGHILEDAFTAMDKGVIVLSRDAHILRFNPVAQRLLPNVQLSAGASFTTGSRQADQQVAQHFARSRSPDFAASPPILINAGGQTRKVLMQIQPVGDGASLALSTAGSIVLLSAVDARSGVEPDLLRKLFGLTPAEARLAALASLGNDAKDLAETLDISPGTAKLVLQRVFKKLGVRKHAELVTKIAALDRNMLSDETPMLGLRNDEP